MIGYWYGYGIGGSSPESISNAWILSTGFWNDSAIWKDNEFWID